MYREKDMQDCLYGLAGWHQNENPDYDRLQSSLLRSDTSLYFQDEHPLVTIENIDQAGKNYDKYNYPAYVGATEYDLGDRVRAVTDSKVYESLQAANQGNEPSASPLFWEEVTPVNQRIEKLTRAAISKVVSQVMAKKKIGRITKSIFENVQLFDGAGSLLNKEVKTGRFVGFQITVDNHRDLTAILRRLGTQFTQPNPNFTLYIFHSSQETPIYSIELNLTKQNSFQWSQLLDEDQAAVLLRYLSEDYAPGGAFYLGYYEDDLQGQAVNMEYNFGAAPAPCSCNKWAHYYGMWSQFMAVVPFSVSANDLVDILPADPGGAKLWDINKMSFDYMKTYGLNLDVTVSCDTTDFLCRERRIFTQAILKQVAVDVLTLIAFNTRNNTIAKETKDLAAYELSNADGREGAQKKLDNALAELNFDTSDLNEACLPQNNSVGVSWGAVG